MTLTVIVCGSRDWTSRSVIHATLKELPKRSRTLDGKIVVYHGDNGYDEAGEPLWGQPDPLAVRGADKLAGAIARGLGYQVIPVTPEWRKYGKGAGPRRNRVMLERANPNLVIAFHGDVSASSGTKDMVAIARVKGIEVLVVSSTPADSVPVYKQQSWFVD